MNDTQTNKVGMFRKVVTFCTDNADALTSVAQIATTSAALATKIDEIEDADTQATADGTGYAEEKAADRVELETLCRRFSRSLVVYAADQNNFVLQRTIDFNPSEFTSMRADKLLQNAQLLSTKATPLMDDLLGVLPADLTAFDTAIEDFETVIATPEEKIGERSAYTQLVAQRIAEADALMDKMRIYMALFEDTNNLLYNQFLAAASIDDTGGSSSSNTTTGTVDANGNKIAVSVAYASSTVITFTNTGTTALEFTLYLGTTSQGDAVAVAAGVIIERNLGEMGSDGDNIRVHNTSATDPGNYKVKVEPAVVL